MPIHDDQTGSAGQPEDRGEEGSLVAEYGLIAIVAATIASLVVKWASGGAVWELFGAVLDKVRVLLGA